MNKSSILFFQTACECAEYLKQTDFPEDKFTVEVIGNDVCVEMIGKAGGFDVTVNTCPNNACPKGVVFSVRCNVWTAQNTELGVIKFNNIHTKESVAWVAQMYVVPCF